MIEPRGLALNRPAILSFPLVDGPDSASIYVGTPAAYRSIGGAFADQRISVSIDTLSEAFVGAAFEDGVPPSDTDERPLWVPPEPPLPLAEPGSRPAAGEAWRCGTGRTEDAAEELDLSSFVDTASPTETEELCPPNTAAMNGPISYGSLSTALEAAEEGDTVEVCPGVHRGPFRPLYVGLTLEGVAPDPRATILTGRLQGTILMASRSPITLRRLTFRRGFDSAVALYNGGLLEDVVFEENASCEIGAGLWAAGNTTVRRGQFIKNQSASDGGGASFYREIFETTGGTPPRTLLEDCRFENNHAGNDGGAVQFGRASHPLEIISSTFIGNSAGLSGGAISWGVVPNGRLNIEGGLFEDNRAGEGGGALSTYASLTEEEVSIRETVFRNNQEQGSSVVSLAAFRGGTYLFEDVVFDESASCTVEAGMVNFAYPGDLQFVDVTMGAEEALCVTDNVLVTWDGVPYP